VRVSRVSEPALRPDWLTSEISVVGLARSGRSVATLLARSGSRVYASDAARTPALETTAAELRAEGVDVDLGTHDIGRIGRSSLLVISPGVPPKSLAVEAAKSMHIDIVSEVEIALRFLPKLNYVAVTGTNGKTTTTALAAHLLRALDLRAVAAGNIGRPLSDVALDVTPPRWVGLEVSSYQLHDTPGIRPNVGILTNVSPNHLDRYDSVDAYYADKKLLFRNATAHSQWVTNQDDPVAKELATDAAGLHARFSIARKADAFLDRTTGQLVVLGTPLIMRSELKLLGDHNVANALAATLAVMLAHPDHRTTDACGLLADGLRSFRALEHRIEIVDEIDDVLWVNDSKSTNVASTLVALAGMTRPTVLLLGGMHKGEPYVALEPELKRTVKKVIAYGEAAQRIERDLKGMVAVEQGGTDFAEVVARARRSAASGDAILLSPACSSFDMFDNYEMRGAEFKRLARAEAPQ